MAVEHNYADFLRAFAEGASIQARYKGLDDSCWISLTDNTRATIAFIDGQEDEWEFRIQPRELELSISTGAVLVINAPLRTAPKEGTKVWLLSVMGEPKCFEFGHGLDLNSLYMLRKGLLFETEEDAVRWEDARQKLVGVA